MDNYVDTIYVCLLFLIYLIIWKTKRASQTRQTGHDPEVIRKSTNPLQSYVYKTFLFLTIYAVALIIIHSLKLQYYSFFSHWDPIDSSKYDLAGFLWGVLGLIVCFISQRQMGVSWRVGIDVNKKTRLVTHGLYSLIRNPTYTGLFMLFSGFWLIWPTWSVGLFFILFFLIIEVQVRCEEEFLGSTHSDDYEAYLTKTNRYIPFIY